MGKAGGRPGDRAPFVTAFQRLGEQLEETASPVSIENANETWGDRTGAIMAWRVLPDGSRRLWCLACQEAGQSWLAPTPCEHILKAKEEEQISTEEAYRTRDELMMEYATKIEPRCHPVPLEPEMPKE